MKIKTTPIQGVVVVESQPFEDHRGSFCRLFCERELEAHFRMAATLFKSTIPEL